MMIRMFWQWAGPKMYEKTALFSFTNHLGDIFTRAANSPHKQFHPWLVDIVAPSEYSNHHALLAFWTLNTTTITIWSALTERNQWDGDICNLLCNCRRSQHGGRPGPDSHKSSRRSSRTRRSGCCCRFAWINSTTRRLQSQTTHFFVWDIKGSIFWSRLVWCWVNHWLIFSGVWKGVDKDIHQILCCSNRTYLTEV